jgi:hypothetical protein
VPSDSQNVSESGKVLSQRGHLFMFEARLRAR